MKQKTKKKNRNERKQQSVYNTTTKKKNLSIFNYILIKYFIQTNKQTASATMRQWQYTAGQLKRVGLDNHKIEVSLCQGNTLVTGTKKKRGDLNKKNN